MRSPLALGIGRTWPDRFLWIFHSLLAVRFWAIALAVLPLSAADNRPNLILFLIDDQNAEQIGAFGGKTWTPNLDRLAAEGIQFTRAHVSSAVCTPSRYSWITGRYAGASHSKIYGDACGGPGRQGFPNFNMALERDRLNIGRVLSEAGYVTGFTGKFHLDSKLDWPEFFGGENGLKEIPKTAKAGPETSALFAHNERVMRRYLQAVGFAWAKHIYPENLRKPYHEHNPEWTISAAVEFIGENKDVPFYLHITPTLLHGGEGSWRNSMDYPLVSGEGELKELPAVMTPRAQLLQTLKDHGLDPDGPAAGEAWVDDAVGAVVNKLKALGIDRRTLFLFAPDHGRDGKGSLFLHNGTRIPMLARWPERIPAGTVCEELVQNIDWAPTCFDIAGAKPPDGYRTDGRSLAPLFATGQATPWRDHLYFEMGYARAVATKDWSYVAIRYPRETVAAIQGASRDRLPRLMSYIGRLGIGVRGAERPGFWDADQLYDLGADPGEIQNLAADPKQADRLRQMRAMLAADVKSIGRPFGEFLPGGNAAPPGQVDIQIEEVKSLEVSGKTVVDPESDTPAPAKKAKRARKKNAEE